MIDIYLTDTIDILNVVTDINGVPTTTTISGVKARVEDYGKLVTDRDGKEVMGDMCIILGDRQLSYHDKVKIKTKNGVAYEQPNKEFLPKQITTWNNFITQQTEVIV